MKNNIKKNKEKNNSSSSSASTTKQQPPSHSYSNVFNFIKKMDLEYFNHL